MFNEQQKVILKGIGGFYYVKTADAVLEAKAKGIFRRQGITPLAGDVVELESSNGDYVISRILPRKNFFVRPPAANVDKLFLVVSSVDPAPNLLVLDKLIAIAQKKDIKPVLLVTKTDVAQADGFIGDYRRAGFKVIDMQRQCDAKQRLLEETRGCFSLLSGNSGVGKSTLLNMLFGDIRFETGETSKKLGRGRHTTREVELVPFAGGYVADTPGFSAVEIGRFEPILKNELQHCFAEFSPYIDNCAFADCSHTVEKGCAVLDALRRGEIVSSRHESYCELYRQASQLSEWQYKK